MLFALTAISIVGVYLAYLYGRHTKQFRWREYWALLAAPLGVSAYLIYETGEKLFYFFFASMIIGFALEYGLGRAYHLVLNKRLWIYNRYKVGAGYTSWLTLPMWGIAGIFFWVLSKHFGL